MMMAALQGGLTFQKGLGAVHALSHPLGGLKEPSLHHGTLNAVILPAVLRFNEPAAPEKYGTLRRTLGLAEHASLPDYFAALTARLGLPGSLRPDGRARILPRRHRPPRHPRPLRRHQPAPGQRGGVPGDAAGGDGGLSYDPARRRCGPRTRLLSF